MRAGGLGEATHAESPRPGNRSNTPWSETARDIDWCRMGQVRGRALRPLSVLGIVVAGHLLVALLLLSSRPAHPGRGPPEITTFLVVLNLNRPHSEEAPAGAPSGGPQTASPKHAVRPRKMPRSVPSEDGQDTRESSAPDASGVNPKKDWRREMDATLQAVMPKIQTQWQRQCDEAERAHALRLPGCNRRSYDEPWRPSGSLLQDLRDPDRPWSSVPDLPRNPFPEAPRPQVYKDSAAR